MMTNWDTQVTVGELVRERPARSRVFEALRIDYCCGGKLSLAEACARRSLDATDVLAQIRADDAATTQRGAAESDVAALGLAELADHIEQTHHVYLRGALPRLAQLIDRVHKVHGEAEPRLAQVRAAFAGFEQEVSQHMLKEERILFPMIRALELTGAQAAGDFHCGSIAHPIRQMEYEHDQAGDALATLRTATDGFAPPEWACNTYRAMLAGLAELEADMHQHIHKENNILFPRALELEQAA